MSQIFWEMSDLTALGTTRSQQLKADAKRASAIAATGAGNTSFVLILLRMLLIIPIPLVTAVNSSVELFPTLLSLLTVFPDH